MDQSEAVDRKSTAIERKVIVVAERAKLIEVTDQESLEVAAALAVDAQTYIKNIGEEFDPGVSSAHAHWRLLTEQRARLLRPAEEAKKELGEKMAKYNAHVRALQEAAEKIAQEEREAREREVRVKALEERDRLRREEESRRLEQATILESQGDIEGADRLLREPVAIPPVVVPATPPVPVHVPPPAVAPGVSFRDDWTYEVTDEDAVPRQYMDVSDVKIRAAVKSMKGRTKIPGVRVFVRRITATRSQ